MTAAVRIWEVAGSPALRADQPHPQPDVCWLEPPAALGDVTVRDVLVATSADAHAELVRAWARSVWDAWAEHHETIRRWADEVARGG